MSDTMAPAFTDADEGTVSEDARHAHDETLGAVVMRTGRGGAAGRRVRADSRDPQATPLRDRLAVLRGAVTSELRRRGREAALEPVDGLDIPITELSSISRELPRLARRAPEAGAAASRAVIDGELLGLLRDAIALVARRALERVRTGPGVEGEVDEFGFDREWTEGLIPLFRFLYERYWRVQTLGLEHVPEHGRALLVSNHAGVLPYDGAMIRYALFAEHPGHRHARALILDAFFAMPVFSWVLRRSGNTLAHPDDAERLLDRDELVLVFPEGIKGTGKLYRDRYRLARFGRGGFVRNALRTGSPIIPVSVVGSEEVHPMLANVGPVARTFGLPYFPITPTFPHLGLLGLLPVPSSWIIEFHEPIRLHRHGVDAADDAALVMQITDEVRSTIQRGALANLERRGSVFA